jgi:enoyl-CoA hydratase/carnithine racemase
MAVAVDKPVIAAINGAVAGIGLVLACSADLRFAAAGAKFTTSFARLGLNAEYGVSWLLSRIVGTSRAADLLFSSRILYAEEAYRIGLVNEVFASDDLLVETMAYAQRLATEVSPRALAEIKRQLVADQTRGLDESIADAVVTMERLTREPDFAEGTAAFAEKRAPSFAPLP